jgi:hypothetical protein
MPGQSNQLGARCQGERTHTRVHVYIAGYNIELYLIILDMPPFFICFAEEEEEEHRRKIWWLLRDPI